MTRDKFLKKIKNLRESPLLAAFAALLLVIFSITLAVSCGGEKGTTEGEKDTGSRSAPGKTTTRATTTQPAAMTTTPSTSVSTRSNSTIWSSVFTRKDPFKQQVQAGGGGTSTTPATGTSTTPSYYTGEIPYYGTNGTNGTTGGTGYTAPSSGGTGYTYPPPVK